MNDKQTELRKRIQTEKQIFDAERAGTASANLLGFHPNPYSLATGEAYWHAWERGFRDVLDNPAHPPTGVQFHRVGGYTLPPRTTLVTRGTAWGNPFRANTVLDNANAVRKFEKTIKAWTWDQLREYLLPLQGRHLACYCRLGTDCHRDLLLRLCRELLPAK